MLVPSTCLWKSRDHGRVVILEYEVHGARHSGFMNEVGNVALRRSILEIDRRRISRIARIWEGRIREVDHSPELQQALKSEYR